MNLHVRTAHMRWNPGFQDWVHRRMADLEAGAIPHGSVRLCATHEDADLVLLVGSADRLPRIWRTNRNPGDSVFRAFPRKTAMLVMDDVPLGGLPGLFTSMPSRNFDRRIHRPFGYLELPTEDEPIPSCERRHLYSFVGGATHPLRKAILAVEHHPQALVQSAPVHNHGNRPDSGRKQAFLELLASSWFVLCPRGVGVNSYRIYESMRCGATPVVLSDELVLPDGPDWEECSVRIPESQVDRIPTVLAGISQSRREEMSQAAGEAYERYFAPPRLLGEVARLAEELLPADHGRARVHFHFRQARVLRERIANRLCGRTR